MPADNLLRETEAFLHEKIPLTRAMRMRLTAYDARQLTLEAPLAANHNHLGTAFGGSLSALATLAGYALLWLELRDRTAHLVIRDSTLRFRRPVRGDLRAICRAPDAATLATFHREFARDGKARITLRVEIEEDVRSRWNLRARSSP